MRSYCKLEPSHNRHNINNPWCIHDYRSNKLSHTMHDLHCVCRHMLREQSSEQHLRSLWVVTFVHVQIARELLCSARATSIKSFRYMVYDAHTLAARRIPRYAMMLPHPRICERPPDSAPCSRRYTASQHPTPNIKIQTPDPVFASSLCPDSAPLLQKAPHSSPTGLYSLRRSSRWGMCVVMRGRAINRWSYQRWQSDDHDTRRRFPIAMNVFVSFFSVM
jgi:hypothetical protein